MALKKGTVTIEYIDTSNATSRDFVLVDLENGTTVYLVTDKAPFADKVGQQYRSDTHLYVDPDATSPEIMRELADYYEWNMSVQTRSQKRAFRKWQEHESDWPSRLPLFIKNTHTPSTDENIPKAGSKLQILIGEPTGNGALAKELSSPVNSVTFHSIAMTEQ